MKQRLSRADAGIIAFRHMKDTLMEILACPVCKGSLELTVTERDENEIVTGSLYCEQCDFHYPIQDTIPNLLPPDMQS